MPKSRGSIFLTVMAGSAAFAMYTLATQKSAPESSRTEAAAPLDKPAPSAVADISTPQTAPSFGGYTCTDDCSGHEAGYAWAEEHDIVDPDDCGGRSESFIEGCQAYAEDYQAESEAYAPEF